jgi:hypothetical protein
VAGGIHLNEQEPMKEIMSTIPTKKIMSLFGEVLACGRCIDVHTKSIV